MPALHLDPRVLAAGLAVLLAAMLLALVQSPPVIDIGSSGGSAAAPSPAAPAASAATTGKTGKPRWVVAPLRAPAP